MSDEVTFPQLPVDLQVSRLNPPAGRVPMILDTDTYNEIDDQFAVVYTVLAQDRFDIQGFTAAPYHNKRSSGPADGMEKSYDEILRLLDFLGEEHPVLRGAASYLPGAGQPAPSEAAEFIIERALAAADDEPLYVVPIGCITNVASAILMEPEVIKKIVVVWLGGNGHSWPTQREFNSRQDLHATRTIYDSGVPLMRVPCWPVASHLTTTLPQVRECVQPHGKVGGYLHDIFADYIGGDMVRAKQIWDISAVAWLINDDWVMSGLLHSPYISDDHRLSVDTSRHLYRCALRLNVTAIFRDLFERLEARAGA